MRGPGGACRDRIVISGALAQRLGVGGHAWVFLQYLLGFRRLGYDVLFVDWLDAETTAAGLWSALAGGLPASVMEEHGLETEPLAARPHDRLPSAAGLPRTEVLRRSRESALLLNVMGYLDDEEILAAAPAASLPRHRPRLSADVAGARAGRRLRRPRSLRHDRRASRPGRLSECRRAGSTGSRPATRRAGAVAGSPGGARSFTTVCSWRGAFGPVEYQGTTYGLRAHELRSFARLPAAAGRRFELALDIDEADRADRELLERCGWPLVDPRGRRRSVFVPGLHRGLEAPSSWSQRACTSTRGAAGSRIAARAISPAASRLSRRTRASTISTGRAKVCSCSARCRRRPSACPRQPATTAVMRRRRARSREEVFDSDRVLRRLVDRLGIG